MVFVERKNRHLLEVARAIMFSMNVPKYLWGDVILTASYLINRMHTRVLNFETPLHSLKKLFPMCRLYSKLPLKVFGCICFVYVPQILRSKLDPTARKCIFMGYALNKKGYRCFNHVTKKNLFKYGCVFSRDSTLFFQKSSSGEEYKYCGRR